MEIQDVMYHTLETQMIKVDRPEISAIVGILQGFNSCLYYNRLTDEQIQN